MKTQVDLGERKVTLLGTAHVSEESSREVEEEIRSGTYDLVAVELDEKRFESLRDKTGWKNLDLAEAIRDGKGYVLLLNLLLSIYQRRIGIEQGAEPGDEMLAAVETAGQEGIDYRLVDRDISETFERLREEMSLWEKFKLLGSFLEGGEEIEIEELKESKMLDQLVKELEQDFPSISKVFLQERNRYMADRVLEESFNHALVVVGAAHVEGMAKDLKSQGGGAMRESRLKIPWLKFMRYGFPLIVVGMLGYSFYRLGFSTGFRASTAWIMINGLLAMLGAIIARSHLATWIVSFAAAPLTSLDPALGAGMVSSYFEAKFYPPRVGELENIAYLDNYRELWQNQAGRILLTFIFVTVGSALATFIGAGYIASLIGF